ncbi:4-hydroxy-3-methylbut-2-enyl diphosphate reductase [uncultured Helicobacter sp.]|uniref:4-hydroxy-3-methylbut-2-enyl diphosphate reductase n=1 Tax=uncultured Helicobacter sp. TaxID=175537 RepID=UPI002638D694|nr:4-hydroxy-3-methylbut-2-enyl diphosphate reductase [uncultured Helicobacter sp.]
MEVLLAKKLGFCFGVRRAIKIAEKNKNGFTLGPLIHNYQEIDRLKNDFNVRLKETYDDVQDGSTLIIRTHGIPKQTLEHLRKKPVQVVDATCPFVTKPQQIVEEMSKEGYEIVIFGDVEHPEIKGVMSYAESGAIVIADVQELHTHKFRRKVALISQTTKQVEKFSEIASYLVQRCSEVRVFNTICNATFDNQRACKDLSQKADIMIVVGGKTSANTKQLLSIALESCKDSYLIENVDEIDDGWFVGKKLCGITAGASTPDWIVERVTEHIKRL